MSCSRPLFFPLLTFLSLVFQPLGWADSHLVLFEQPGRLSFTGFGPSLALVGDLDADGVPDSVVGAYEHFWNNNLKQGRAFVFSGRTGKLLYALDPPHLRQAAGSGASPFSGASFGWAVAAAGDLDGDSAPDLVVGAPYAPVGASSAFPGLAPVRRRLDY